MKKRTAILSSRNVIKETLLMDFLELRNVISPESPQHRLSHESKHVKLSGATVIRITLLKTTMGIEIQELPFYDTKASSILISRNFVIFLRYCDRALSSLFSLDFGQTEVSDFKLFIVSLDERKLLLKQAAKS